MHNANQHPLASAKPPDTAPRWPKAIVLAHWATVGVIIVGVAAIYGREAADGRWLRSSLLNAHQWAGMLVWVVCWTRLILRLLVYRPQWRRPATGQLMKWVAATTHVALYALLLVVPLLGLTLSNARGQSLSISGWSVPMLVERDLDLADELESVHEIAALTLLALALFHALAAFWHRFVLKDDVLASMSVAPKNNETKACPSETPSSPPVQPT